MDHPAYAKFVDRQINEYIRSIKSLSFDLSEPALMADGSMNGEEVTESHPYAEYLKSQRNEAVRALIVFIEGLLERHEMNGVCGRFKSEMAKYYWSF
jgi:hypothetical protein